MPCTKCEEGNYKWGETGECEYPTKEACESANSKYSKMKPTPLGKKTYEEYEKELKEFNLSKVELGLVQDLKEGITKAKADISYLKKLDREKIEAYKTIEKVFDISSNMNDGNFYGKIGIAANKAVKQAKELGVDLPEAKQMKDLSGDFFKWFSKVNSKK